MARPLPAIREKFRAEVQAGQCRRGSLALPKTFEERVADFAFGRLGSVLDLGEKLRFYPDPPLRDPLGIGLRLPDQRLQPLLQVGDRSLVEPVVDLTGIDELLALPAVR